MSKYDKYFKKPDMGAAKKRTKDKAVISYDKIEIDEQLKKHAKGKNYFVRTYGCQMNDHDSEIICGILDNAGYNVCEDIEQADVIIFNTCAIREGAENKVFGEIGRLQYLKKNNPDLIFAVCGCMSQEENVVNRLLKTYHHIDIIFGTHNIHRLPQLLLWAIMDSQRVVEVWSEEGGIVEDLPKNRDSKYKAWINIIYGCDKFCTYCIVPYTRGAERSRAHTDIIKEINDLVNDGYKEITLLGQNVNAYGKDLGTGYTMANLLEDAAKTGIERIRFMSSHPWDFTDEMIDVIEKHKSILPHIHLPVQSGSSSMLKIMGRNYSREQYITLYDKLKKARPDFAFTTDIIVGFPNETDEQFEETLSIYDYCQFDGAFTFIYSPREGTPAAKMEDNISDTIKKERLAKLNVSVKKHAKQKYLDMLGQTVSVLVDSESTKNKGMLAGYDEHMKLVIFEGDKSLIGQIVDVEITEPYLTNLIGKLK